MSTLEAIIEELRTLPAPKLAEAAGYVHRLWETSREEHLVIRRETAGAWNGPDGEAIEKAIEEDCVKVDASGW
jgi:hypothetical protein